jgi:Fe-S oxidoreductase
MGNGHQSYASPRDLLKALPGVEFVELEESNVCCGGAGTYCLKHPGLADDVLEKKLENIRKSGAQVVVTQASSCLLHVGYGLRKKGWNIRVMHLAEFLQALKRGS